jgi:hypothetical protein
MRLGGSVTLWGRLRKAGSSVPALNSRHYEKEKEKESVYVKGRRREKMERKKMTTIDLHKM